MINSEIAIYKTVQYYLPLYRRQIQIPRNVSNKLILFNSSYQFNEIYISIISVALYRETISVIVFVKEFPNYN